MGAVIEKAGIPVVSIVAPEYTGLVRTAARAQGLSSLAAAEIPFAVLSGAVEDVRPSCEAVIDDIISGLTEWKPEEADTGTEIVAEESEKWLVFEGKDYQDATDKMDRVFLSQKWGDGLPLIPPTRERVEWMLTGTDLPRDKVLTTKFGPRFRPITVQDVAVNAVMAGARPEYLPVILAAVDLLATEEGLKVTYTMTESQHSFAPVLIVNGPVARELNINSSIGLMGPGQKANATIGRAMSLVLINGAGAYAGPGGTPATQSLLGRYTWCFAENEENNPWQPLHVELGYGVDVSTVTIMAGRGTQAVFVSPPADKILASIALAIQGITVRHSAVSWDQLLVLSSASSGDS